MIRITVPGESVPWSVHRRGDPKAARMKAWAQAVKWAAMLQHRRPVLRGPVVLSIVVYRAKGLPRAKQARADALAGLVRPVTAPDSTNLQKCVEDALQGIVYANDSAVVDVRTQKWYGEPARVEIEVSAWKPTPAVSPLLTCPDCGSDDIDECGTCRACGEVVG